MENEEKKGFLEGLLGFFLLFLCICCLFEIGLFIYGYINADKVECNWLWCTFTSGEVITIKEGYEPINFMSGTNYYNCCVNGEKINCSELEEFNQGTQISKP